MTQQAARKPRIALMGEFSAGKSTLSNLLLGSRPLPERVTATRLSPVWMAEGTQDPYRIDIDGSRAPVSLDALEGIPVDETKVIRLFFEADILTLCDLIDFPGISDPNMSSEVWQRMVPEVDAVLWCTHATQAWRQSEAAAWETIPSEIRERSLLLVTKYDKLLTEKDKKRVVTRLRHETKGLFSEIFPISLTGALSAGEDYEAFERAGGATFLEHLIPMIDALSGEVADRPDALIPAPPVVPAILTEVESEAEDAADVDQPSQPDEFDFGNVASAIATDTPAAESANVPEKVAETQTAETLVASALSFDVPAYNPDEFVEDLEDAQEPAPSPSNLRATPVPQPEPTSSRLHLQEIEPAAAILPRRVRPAGNMARPKRPPRPMPEGFAGPNERAIPRNASHPQRAQELRSIFDEGDGKGAG